MRQTSLIVQAAFGIAQLEDLLKKGWEVVHLCPFHPAYCPEQNAYGAIPPKFTEGKILVILQHDEPDPESKPNDRD